MPNRLARARSKQKASAPLTPIFIVGAILALLIGIAYLANNTIGSRAAVADQPIIYFNKWDSLTSPGYNGYSIQKIPQQSALEQCQTQFSAGLKAFQSPNIQDPYQVVVTNINRLNKSSLVLQGGLSVLVASALTKFNDALQKYGDPFMPYNLCVLNAAPTTPIKMPSNSTTAEPTPPPLPQQPNLPDFRIVNITTSPYSVCNAQLAAAQTALNSPANAVIKAKLARWEADYAKILTGWNKTQNQVLQGTWSSKSYYYLAKLSLAWSGVRLRFKILFYQLSLMAEASRKVPEVKSYYSCFSAAAKAAQTAKK